MNNNYYETFINTLSREDIERTDEYKEFNVIKFTDKKGLSDAELRKIMLSIPLIKLSMGILEAMGILHDPIIESNLAVITSEAAKEKYLKTFINMLHNTKNNAYGINKKTEVSALKNWALGVLLSGKKEIKS